MCVWSFLSKHCLVYDHFLINPWTAWKSASYFPQVRAFSGCHVAIAFPFITLLSVNNSVGFPSFETCVGLLCDLVHSRFPPVTCMPSKMSGSQQCTQILLQLVADRLCFQYPSWHVLSAGSVRDSSEFSSLPPIVNFPLQLFYDYLMN